MSKGMYCYDSKEVRDVYKTHLGEEGIKRLNEKTE